ncbi:MAG: methyltransferase domain-containing protein [Chloroflexi bacterium]|uniref:Methyltransferase domain-containing protein n=1 Tax=Candidatus Chlorohelix allophototropha TaxID=3003348 RepID=A0A8T7M3K0_9CHLR|nr:methyltransferase domain-containing protein [Chloroflexota bacterium]WJW65513.1 methyltransferase domain-containing protein [Chloroflexota bacterium L227-S17]
MKLSAKYRALVAHLYDRSLEGAENKYFQEQRRKVVETVSGTVLELGAGTGANLPYYQPKLLQKLVLTEPDEFMLQKLSQKTGRYRLPLEYLQVGAENLPFPNASFDYVVTTLVLCSVGDLAKSLAEVRRVLKPGGELRFFEHVRAEGRISVGLQTIITPLWKVCAVGCHLNRDTYAAIEKAGFRTNGFSPSRVMRVTIFPFITGTAISS